MHATLLSSCPHRGPDAITSDTRWGSNRPRSSRQAPAAGVADACRAARAGVVILYLHGGGYVIGSPRSHRHLAAAIARAAASRALVLDYRLAPEHPFPAALDDAVAAYRWLLEQGITPARIVIAGDSAGGGLAVATLVALRDRGLVLPAAGVCISPWVDLTCTAASYTTNAPADPIVRPAIIAEMARAYLAGTDPRLASPLYADPRGLPPLLIHVGGDEVLLDDAAGLAERAKAAGVAGPDGDRRDRRVRQGAGHRAALIQSAIVCTTASSSPMKP